ncbi:MAG: ATP-binding cassette domain-containing protein [Rickettsiaceae bacterium]|nr:ATP-binding cassette domain-containing protein [Rickettsiaceae bacterium]
MSNNIYLDDTSNITTGSLIIPHVEPKKIVYNQMREKYNGAIWTLGFCLNMALSGATGYMYSGTTGLAKSLFATSVDEILMNVGIFDKHYCSTAFLWTNLLWHPETNFGLQRFENMKVFNIHAIVPTHYEEIMTYTSLGIIAANVAVNDHLSFHKQIDDVLETALPLIEFTDGRDSNKMKYYLLGLGMLDAVSMYIDLYLEYNTIASHPLFVLGGLASNSSKLVATQIDHLIYIAFRSLGWTGSHLTYKYIQEITKNVVYNNINKYVEEKFVERILDKTNGKQVFNIPSSEYYINNLNSNLKFITRTTQTKIKSLFGDKTIGAMNMQNLITHLPILSVFSIIDTIGDQFGSLFKSSKNALKLETDNMTDKERIFKDISYDLQNIVYTNSAELLKENYSEKALSAEDSKSTKEINARTQSYIDELSDAYSAPIAASLTLVASSAINLVKTLVPPFLFSYPMLALGLCGGMESFAPGSVKDRINLDRNNPTKLVSDLIQLTNLVNKDIASLPDLPFLDSVFLGARYRYVSALLRGKALKIIDPALKIDEAEEQLATDNINIILDAINSDKKPGAEMTTNSRNVFSLTNYELKLFDKTQFKINDITLKAPGIYAIMGPSGIGKTCMLKDIAGCLVHPLSSHGSVSLPLGADGAFQEPIFIDQHFFVPSKISLLEMITLKYRNSISQAEQKMLVHKIQKLMQILEIDSFAASGNFEDGIAANLLNPDYETVTLSGGQRKKLNIIKAIISGAKIIFTDEIFAGLDTESMVKVQQLIKEYLSDSIIINVDHYAISNNHNGFYDRCFQITEEHGALEVDLASSAENDIIYMESAENCLDICESTCGSGANDSGYWSLDTPLDQYNLDLAGVTKSE